MLTDPDAAHDLRMEQEAQAMREEPEESNVDAFYASDGYVYWPALACSCGWGKMDKTWELCGKALDEHLEERHLHPLVR